MMRGSLQSRREKFLWNSLIPSIVARGSRTSGTFSHHGRTTNREEKTRRTAIEVDRVSSSIMPYEDIPGPKGLPLIGNTFRFLPYVGEYGNVPLVTQLRMLRDTYGDIVKLEGIVNRRSLVLLFDAELCEKMYRLEGVWPKRIALESLDHYRRSRDDVFHGKYGLTTSQGKEWHEFRSKVNQHMMQPRVVKPHVRQINEITDEFLNKMREMRDPKTLELPPTFNNELNKWALEAICSIALNHRLGCLRSNLTKDSEPQTMIDCVHEMFDLMFRLEIMPSMWKLYDTSNLRKLFRVLDKLNGIAIKHVNRAKEKLEESSTAGTRNEEDPSVLEKLLRVDEQTARVMALDMLMAGIDTTGNASAALLFYLATNPEKQEKLRKEAELRLPTKSSAITSDTLARMPYLKACVKESLRLFPISIGTLRTMQADIVLGGYLIPKECDAIACHALLAVDSKHFPYSERFVPERWLRCGDTFDFPPANNAHPFAYMPFGFGARTCVGRRFAELEMEVLLLKVVRNFRMEWERGPLRSNSGFINTVASPLQLKLIDL